MEDDKKLLQSELNDLQTKHMDLESLNVKLNSEMILEKRKWRCESNQSNNLSDYNNVQLRNIDLESKILQLQNDNDTTHENFVNEKDKL